MKLLSSKSNSPLCKSQLPERRTLMRSMLLKLGTALALCFGAANLAHATQNGGTVTIRTVTTTAEWNTAVANGGINVNGAGSDSGGTVMVNLPTPVDLSSVGPNFISANGGPGNGATSGGPGGNVVISNATGTSNGIDVNTIISVEGGPSLGANTLDGSIMLNGVTCQQYATGNTSWPTSYWDCTEAAPTHLQSDLVINNLPSVQALLADNNVWLYTMASASSHNTFFSKNNNTTSIGRTFYLPNSPPPTVIYTAVFSRPDDPEEQTETAAHEIGHAINDSNFAGEPLVRPSEGSSYILFVTQDWLRLDYSTISSSEATSTYRDPCTATGLDPAPLAGVVDNTTAAPYCSGGALVNPVKYGNLTNSAILTIAEPHIFGATWSELYAQTFAFVAYAYQNVADPTILTHPTADQLFNSAYPTFNMGYFVCSVDWAKAALAGTFTTPSNAPSYCSQILSGWTVNYAPYQHKTH